MTIKIYAEELIRRCLWDHYVHYIIGSDKEAEKLLKENKELELSEREALVIGLLKIIETDNLIHKFNTYVVEFLTNKSIREKDTLLLRKKSFDIAIDKFLDKFPDYWEPNLVYANALKELVVYIDGIKKEIEKLEIYNVIDKNVSYEFYSSNSVKKLLKFNY